MTNIKAEIPTIDIQPWLSGTNPDLVVDQVRAACQTYGFFQLVGHDIPLEMQQSILDCAKKFFSLPLDQKSLLKKDPVTGRGYEGFGSQSLQATTTTDRKEAFRIGRDVPKEEPVWGTYLYGSNLWPTLPDHEFKTPAMKYRDHMLRLATEILKILARGLPCSDDVFNDFMQDPVASVKLLHYPPQEDDGCEAIGAGAHTDFGAITILLQHPGQEGLEVLHPAISSWIPVPNVKNTFVVNIGDVLSAWTGGQYRSATHRVVNRSTTVDRYSVPFFYDGTMTATMNMIGESERLNGKKTVGDHFVASWSAVDGQAQVA